MSRRPKRNEYEVMVSADGAVAPDGHSPLVFPHGWTPEHLILAALATCSLASLGFHARRGQIAHTATGSATGAVTQREDGRWGFVEIECRIDVQLDPLPDGHELSHLLARAERGCFVGASLEPKPRYRWRVNGSEIA